MTAGLSRGLVSALLRRITVGSLIVLEGGERRVYGSGPPGATVRIDSARTWPKLLRGSRGMAEAFAQGLWDSPDWVASTRPVEPALAPPTQAGPKPNAFATTSVPQTGHAKSAGAGPVHVQPG